MKKNGIGHLYLNIKQQKNIRYNIHYIILNQNGYIYNIFLSHSDALIIHAPSSNYYNIKNVTYLLPSTIRNFFIFYFFFWYLLNQLFIVMKIWINEIYYYFSPTCNTQFCRTFSFPE